ncbi:hypothetical protein [Glycomyces sp. NPDC047010]|uniref:hypothetical protein n=1 Tax=Glycomyces sp. NPDC047010 TaxID=3155023 RepID=UPI00341122A0
MRTFTRRLALASTAVIAGTAIAFAAGSPTQAGASECFTHLTSNGYSLTAARKTACVTAGAQTYPKGYDACVKSLAGTGVARGVAEGACRRAGQ